MKALSVTHVRFLRALPLVVVALLGAYGLVASAGALGGVLLVAILVLGGALALWARTATWPCRHDTAHCDRSSAHCPGGPRRFLQLQLRWLLPGLGRAWPLAVGVLLVGAPRGRRAPARLVRAGSTRPARRARRLAGLGAAVPVLVARPGRATVGFHRDLLYLFGLRRSSPRSPLDARPTWAVRGVALAMAGVAALALSPASRRTCSRRPAASVRRKAGLPTDLLERPRRLLRGRGRFLSAPLLRRRSPVLRVLGAVALPVIGTTLLLTYSRGGLLVAVIGLAAYAVFGRPRGLLSALVAAAPGTAVAMKSAYDDTLLSGANPTSAAAVHQGHDLALVVLLCVVSAVVLRTLLLFLDRALEGESSPIDRHQTTLKRTAIGVTAIAVVVALALGAPGAIAHRWDQFVNQQATPTTPLIRSRLTSTSNNGRIELWTIAWNEFRAHPLDGTGAETFEISFYEHRPGQDVVVNAHSLYIETLGELGIVGLLFVLLFVLGTLAGLTPARRGRDRALYAALFSAALAWSLHAGVDWDWQMPAASLWLAALGGLALGRRSAGGESSVRSVSVRSFAAGIVVVGACVFPALVLASQIRLNEATSAYAAGNCTSADQLARSSIDILGTRAPSWQIEALCAVQAHDYRTAEMDLRGGLAADPSDWQLQAALAAATAAAGSDARAEVALARRLNPNDPGIRTLARALAGGPSAKARQAARTFLSQQSLIESG